MSEVKDKFYEVLILKMETKGYAFKKSKNQFVKNINDATCSISFYWDGRGGFTYLRDFYANISYQYLIKAQKNILGRSNDFLIAQSIKDNLSIPQMYSKAFNDLINTGNLKLMAAMPFEEKYPIEKIEKCANKVFEIVETELFSFIEKMVSENKILEHKKEQLLESLNKLETHNCMIEILNVKIMCKKLKIQEPQFIQDINIFTNKSIDDLWNMQEYEYDKMQERFDNLKF